MHILLECGFFLICLLDILLYIIFLDIRLFLHACLVIRNMVDLRKLCIRSMLFRMMCLALFDKIH